MNTFFIGSLYPDDRLEEIKLNCKPGGIDNAANNFQWALIHGLDNYFHNLNIITQPSIRTYPGHYKNIYIKSSTFSHRPGSNDICLGFVNVPLIKHVNRYLNLYQTLKHLISKEEETLLIIYSINSPFLKAVSDLKESGWSKIRTCLIVPDLAQFMRETKNQIYLTLKKIDLKIINTHLKQIDSFVLLSKFMVDFIDVQSKPWVLVEGIYNSEDDSLCNIKEENKTILYTGNLDERYGIKTLLKAFKMIPNKNFRLWIRGDGKTKEDVMVAAQLDSRIVYYNEMPRKELLGLLKRATVLINPVPECEQFTKYFFPSKLMDYMASGTPAITTNIKSIPGDYKEYLYFAETDDANGLKDIILRICEKPHSELSLFGDKASKFIKEKKNSKEQARKIYEMVNNS